MGFYYLYLKKHVVPFFAAIACVSCEACCDLLGPTLMANIINQGIARSSSAAVMHWGALMLAVTAAGACFAIVRNVLASRVSQRFGADLRLAVFDKILRFSEEAIDEIQSGSLITRMTGDTTQVTQFINGMMRIFLKAPLTCAGSIILATMLNAKLALVIYALVALVSLCIFFAMKTSYPRFAALQKAVDAMNSTVQEYLLGIRLVKAFGTYGTEEKRFALANGQVYKTGVAAQTPVTLLSPLMTLFVGAGTVLVLFFGARLFAAGETLPGDISAFIIYMMQILASLIMITNIFTVFVRTRASAVRVREVMDAKEDFLAGGLQLPAVRGALTFDHVTFAYPSGSGLEAVQDVSFFVGAGEHLAVIGPTGSGKSTLIWLLLRFYDPGAGRILLDGADIKTLDTAFLRAAIALVPQKVFLSAGTVAENLAWGNPGADEGVFALALAAAQADFVSPTPAGLASRIESGGVNLSGGQKQRLALARALVRDAPVLVLDDATSALDAITEARVLAALRQGERQKQTLVTVTQRCGTAMKADRILVLEDGLCVGFGSHAQLLETCAAYRGMYRSQIAGGRENFGGGQYGTKKRQ